MDYLIDTAIDQCEIRCNKNALDAAFTDKGENSLINQIVHLGDIIKSAKTVAVFGNLPGIVADLQW
jgi:hypothetical protein